MYLITLVNLCLQEARSTISKLSSDEAWIIAGDFNTITTWEEKRGGDAAHDGSFRDFNEFMLRVDVSDAGYRGCPNTWSNNQSGAKRVWVRLDWVLINGCTISSFSRLQMTHLERGVSDHAPLLIQTQLQSRTWSSFKYMGMWKLHDDFHRVVLQAWEGSISSNSILNFTSKLKKLSGMLGRWNRSTFGNVNEGISEEERKIAELNSNLTNWDETKVAELRKEQHNLTSLLHKKQIMLEEEARVNWIKKGNENTSFFHAMIKDRASIRSLALRTRRAQVSWMIRQRQRQLLRTSK
uniref:Endonuclease/exonuclease/phosphatase domain-containing protein n=1 Tax=Kalanchoe fedtschenkoi TaxID=63787 RepID=A0A7N0V3L8_KALFE